MSFYRNPFQFKSTDLAERHSELMKRFGVSPTDNMHLETSNADQACEQSSPRLQHRIPLGLANGLEMASSGNNAENVDSGQQKPKVRIIPIQIEGAVSQGSERQRTRSGGSVQNSHLVPEDKVKSSSTCSLPVSAKNLCDMQGRRVPMQHEMSQLNNASSKSKVIDIPVFVEGRNSKKMSEEPPRMNKVNIPVEKVGSQINANAPASKPLNNGTIDMSNTVNNKVKVSSYIISMDKISAVLKELDLYKESVENFSGVQGDKQYRYLDEMLTRCMLKLDDVETHGNEDIRKARRAAVKEVEKYVCMLDSKIKVSADEIVNSENEVTESANNESGQEEEVIGELLDSVQETVEEKSKEKMETDIQETVTDKDVTSTVASMKDDIPSEDVCIESQTEDGEMNQNSSVLKCVEKVDSNVENCVEQKSEDETAGHAVHSEEEMLVSDNELADAEKSTNCNAMVEEKVEIDAENRANVSNEVQEEMEVDLVPVKSVNEPTEGKLEAPEK